LNEIRLEFVMCRAALIPLCAMLAFSLSGCAVVSVVDAAVTVGVTAVKVGATVVETTVDVAAAGVKAATGADSDEPQNGDEGQRHLDDAPLQGDAGPVRR